MCGFSFVLARCLIRQSLFFAQSSVAQCSSTENVITLRGSTDVVTDFFYYAVNRHVLI